MSNIRIGLDYIYIDRLSSTYRPDNKNAQVLHYLSYNNTSKMYMLIYTTNVYDYIISFILLIMLFFS